MCSFFVEFALSGLFVVFTGKTNPMVKLAVVKVRYDAAPEVPAATWLDLVEPADASYTTVESLTAGDVSATGTAITTSTVDYYVARVGWWKDGSVMVQMENRAQTVLQLLRVDPHTGK